MWYTRNFCRKYKHSSDIYITWPSNKQNDWKH